MDVDAGQHAPPAEAVALAAELIHDDECLGGDTKSCGRWRCGSDAESRFHLPHAGHVEYYRDKAQAVIAAAWPVIAAQAAAAERRRLAGDGSNDALGRLVRETWVEWAREQPAPKPSWLTGWDDLDAGQREADSRIGRTVVEIGRVLGARDERDRILGDDPAAGVYRLGVEDGAKAERERIRSALLACTDCGKVHEKHRATEPAVVRDARDASGFDSWASLDDGHAYRPWWRQHHASIDGLLGEGAASGAGP